MYIKIKHNLLCILYLYVKYFDMKSKVDKDIPMDVKDKLKKIGGLVREHRKAIEKNYEVFAKKHDINKVTLARIEGGQNFTMSSLLTVLAILDISPRDFFNDIK